MKYTFYLILLLSVVAVQNSFAQEQTRQERVEALRVAFITNELNLSPKESEKFWPLYNEFRTKSASITKKGQKKHRPNLDEMTDKEIEEWLDDGLKAKEEKIALQREYSQKLKKVIGIRKVAQLQMAERKFKRTLLERARERKGRH